MRQSRILQKGAKYHISSKINRSEHLFEDNDIKKLFMDVIKRARKKYKFMIHNFVIMNNHIHLIIEPLNEESLSRIMQWILSVFSMYYNKIHNLKGHTWQSRFWSKIIDDIKQLFDTFRYISENPVKANMINDAKEYKYGGLYYIIKNIFDIVDRPEFDYEY